MGAGFALTRFSLVRISIRDLFPDRNLLPRNSGFGGGGQNRILDLVVPQSWGNRQRSGRRRIKERGKRPPAPTVSALLRKRAGLQRANSALTLGTHFGLLKSTFVAKPK